MGDSTLNTCPICGSVFNDIQYLPHVQNCTSDHELALSLQQQENQANYTFIPTTPTTPVQAQPPLPPLFTQPITSTIHPNVPSTTSSRPKGEKLKIIEGRKIDAIKFVWACKYSALLLSLPKEIKKVISTILYYEREFRVGDLVDVLDTVNKWYPCIILKIDENLGIFIHYYGWSPRYDEWLILASPRIDPLWTHKEEYGRILGIEHSINTDHKTCQHCVALKSLMDDKNFWK